MLKLKIITLNNNHSGGSPGITLTGGSVTLKQFNDTRQTLC